MNTVKINDVSILSTSGVVGKKESEGPLGKYFDEIIIDCEEPTWEQEESHYMKRSIELSIKKANLTNKDIDYIFAGDLLDQSTSAVYGVKDFEIPYIGLFGACSTIGLGMGMASLFLNAGYCKYALTSASSHFGAAEKQFRSPLELGTQRPPTSGWTVTGAGTVLLQKGGTGPKITYFTTGKIVDMGIKDPTNMGAAMAPAAANTIITHFKDTKTDPSYYDMIVTGDLGGIGRELAFTLMKEEGYTLNNYTDCGILIYNKRQDTHAGGSGCACSAVTFASFLYKKMLEKEIKTLLFVPTGALMSATSIRQKRPMMGIAHAISIEI